MLERDLERGLIAHVRDFILEVGKGFSFYGVNIALKWAARISILTCCSIMSVFVVMWSSISKSRISNRSLPVMKSRTL